MMDAVTSYATMLPIFLMDLPGVRETLAKQSLYLAGRKFCMDTELYEKELEPIDVVESTQTYSLSALIPDETKIIRLDEIRYGTGATDETSTPYENQNYSLVSEINFRFRAAPDTSITDGLVCNVILRPTVGSTGLESWFFDRYFEAINAYAKYHLLRMDKKKPWADATRASDFLDEYRNYLNRYKMEKFTEFKHKDVYIEQVPARF